MLYMVIEHFHEGAAPEIYRRFRERGRMSPPDVRYVASWVDLEFRRCFQVMDAPGEESLRAWFANWDDLVDFEVVPVQSSEQAARARAEADGASGPG